VQAGHADVVDPGGARAERGRGERRLGRDRRVGGAGGHHPDQAARLRQRPHRGTAGHRVDERVGEPLDDRCERGIGQPGGQHGPLRVGHAERAEEVDDLRRGLAGAEDHLGVAGARGPVGVHPGVPEIDVARFVVHGSTLRRPAGQPVGPAVTLGGRGPSRRQEVP
jgi:hypothetical protein